MVTLPYQAEKETNSRLLREDLSLRSTELRGLPEVIGVHTTERCNLRCIMCPRSLGQGKLQLPRETLAKVLNELFPTAQKAALSAAAGEPLLADFDLVLGAATEYGVLLDIVTNGTVLTPDAYREAAPIFDHVNVSIDSHVPDIYARIRAGGTFAQVDDNLRGIAELRRSEPDDVLLSLSAVVMRSNLASLPDFVRYAASVGADGVILQHLRHEVKATRDEDPQTDPGPAAIRKTLEATRSAARESGINLLLGDLSVENEMVKPLREKRPPILLGQGLCNFMAQQFAILPTGEVYPCCFPTDHILGNLMFQSPLEIWNGPAAQSLRAAHFSRAGTLFCRGCIHAPHLRAPQGRFHLALVTWLRRQRMRLGHYRNRWRRSRWERSRSRRL